MGPAVPRLPFFDELERAQRVLSVVQRLEARAGEDKALAAKLLRLRGAVGHRAPIRTPDPLPTPLASAGTIRSGRCRPNDESSSGATSLLIQRSCHGKPTFL